MEEDGMEDNIATEPSSDVSLSNDTIEKQPIIKNASNFASSEPGTDTTFDEATNNISGPETASRDGSQPPNGEQDMPSPEPVQEQGNENLDSHLESNANIIENQNNENLERDNELMESERVELPSVSESASQPSSIDCASKNNSASVCNDGYVLESVETDGKTVSDDFNVVPPGSEPISDPSCESLDNNPISSESEIVNKNNSVLTTDSTKANFSSVINETSDESSISNNPHFESEEHVNVSISEGLPSEHLNIAEHNEKDSGHDDGPDPTIQEVDPINVSSLEEAQDGSEKISDSDQLNDELQELGKDIQKVTDIEFDGSKITEVNISDIDKSKDIVVDQSISEDCIDVPETSAAEERSDEECRHLTEATAEENKSTTQESTEQDKDNIEFPDESFDVDDERENEKTANRERDSDSENITTVTQVLESLDSSQGADEEITIIPDSEREITEEEKEAASILPTLKDISDKTTTTEMPDQETDPVENEIKIYKYDKDVKQECIQCKETKSVKYHFLNTDQEVTYICDDECLNKFKTATTTKVTMLTDEGAGLRVKNFIEGPPKEVPALTFIRKCSSCNKVTDDMETNLTWEIMDFCNERCLSKYQKLIGSKCASCVGDVKSTALGKYCVRFGNDIRQFCSSGCLEHYKKGLKVCSYCQQDMSNIPDGFLAPVGEKGQFKDFCSKSCMEKYDIMTNDRPPSVKPGTTCSVCKADKPITIKFDHEDNTNYFCGEPCFVAFAFVNKISPGKCAMCRRDFNKALLEKYTMYYDNVQYSFCSNSCENIYIIAHRKIVPCSWCKVKKYNFDMIKKYSKTDPVLNMCSINCLNMYQVSLSVVQAKPTTCNFCSKQSNPSYHLTMSDGTLRNFCAYNCVMSYQNQFSKQITIDGLVEPVPTDMSQDPKRGDSATSTSIDNITQLPVITNVQSLANTNGTITPPLLPPGLTPISTRLTRSKTSPSTPIQQSATIQSVQNIQNLDLPVQVQLKQQYIVKNKSAPEQRNVAIMCHPKKTVKAVQVIPTMKDACIQTDREDITKILVPIPVPIYVPTPCHMYATPVPIPVPFPIPIPIPIFIPTTRNSAAGIMKEIKKIQVKIPTDPYEAELLMMAEMVAEEKKEDPTDSESDLDDNTGDVGGDYSPEPVDASNTFGDDMLQMALKMATELDEPAVDLEGALTANTITAPQGGHPPETHTQEEAVDDPQPIHSQLMERASLRGRKRGMRGSTRGPQSKRGRRMSHQVDMPMMQPIQPPVPPEPQEKPDANMCLKYTFGVNAWKQWVTTKNAELEKSTRRVKLFKTEILQLTADELNYSLCLFVKEVRKPNGQEYAPDTIYYLCLGIQQYLFENGRIDNIFCDPYYEKFTDCLDEVAKKFSVLYNDSHYIVTRVEEEHLWESKQLGAHSPHVLLSTLMFFNTKHFNLTTVDEHMQLSFSHIMKHWKRNPNQPGASKVPGSRNVLLRFYPPQSALQNNQRKKKVYEQQENEENPLRCPVKLYEFYLSKCPESVKTRNDVFYLQPERSCVPDSPVWYSTMPLPKEALEKMLHRVKMVKEINVALLTS